MRRAVRGCRPVASSRRPFSASAVLRAPDALASLKGQTVAVTGANGGIGRVIVGSLVRHGCTVLAVGRASARDQLAELEAEHGAGCKGVTADLMSAQDCERLAELLGPVDHLVNSAGLARVTPLMEQTADDWDATMNLNARAVFLASQSVARRWIAEGRRGTSICNVSSQASEAPLPGHLTYCASKAAVDMITRMMAMELGPHGIRVNAVNPTVVLTAMGRENWSDPQKAEPMLNSIPLGRFAEPEECSEVIAWLLSDGAAMVNGVRVPIDGGFLATRANLMARPV